MTTKATGGSAFPITLMTLHDITPFIINIQTDERCYGHCACGFDAALQPEGSAT